MRPSPIVLGFCTDKDHHGPSLGKELNNIKYPLVDMAPYEDNRLRVEHEAPIKNWPQAYWRLMKQINPDEAIVFETELKEMKLEYVLSSYYGPSAKDLKNIIS